MQHLAAFRQVFARHLGETLTPAIAVAIEAAYFEQPDLSIDPAQFKPDEYGGYTIAAESFTAILPELHPLHQAHWLETEKHRHGLPLAPDYEGMKARERAGGMVQFTVRCDGQLVGNLRMWLATSAHSGTRYADEDTLYLAPDHRGGFLAMHLLRYAERSLMALGVREIRADSKLLNRADVLMRRMGYTPYALKFVKIIEGN